VPSQDTAQEPVPVAACGPTTVSGLNIRSAAGAGAGVQLDDLPSDRARFAEDSSADEVGLPARVAELESKVGRLAELSKQWSCLQNVAVG
jgi:hypothetical protein